MTIIRTPKGIVHLNIRPPLTPAQAARIEADLRRIYAARETQSQELPPMTLDELRTEYVACVRILRQERKMRQRVFGVAEPDTAAAKVAEINRVLALLEWMKDQLKVELAQPEQGKLLDVPPKHVSW